VDGQKNIFVKHFGLRGIAIFEAGKGLLGVVGAIWVLTLLHKDMHLVAGHIVKFLHLNPDRSLYRSLLHAIGGVTPGGLLLYALLIMLYADIRFAQAVGLWLKKEWAEWFALISGSLYLPVEIYHLVHRPTIFKLGLLTVSALIVVYMAWFLMDSHRKKKEEKQTSAAS